MIYGLLAEPSCFCATGAKSHKEWSSPLILNRTVQCASSLNWIKLVAVAVRLRNKSCSSLKLWLMGFRPHPPVSVEVQSQARSGRALIPDNLNCQLPGERCIWFIEESLKCLDLTNLTLADNTQHRQLQFAQIMIYELCRTCLSVCYCVYQSVSEWVSEWVSDKGTYRAVWGQLKITGKPKPILSSW